MYCFFSLKWCFILQLFTMYSFQKAVVSISLPVHRCMGDLVFSWFSWWFLCTEKVSFITVMA